jgi:hypothetical protein
MSHVALRRVVIRLLHDAALVDRLARDPDAALTGADLSSAERAWLLAVPVNAWRTDANRPRRVLAALADEYPATVRAAPARPAAFFSSPHFHSAVQDRGSLALAFGGYMSEDADRGVVALARLELAAAVVRRAPRRVPASPAGMLRLSPRAAVVRVAAGAAELLDAVRDGRTATTLGQTDEPLLVARSADGVDVAIERLEAPLAALLERALEVVPTPELERLVVTLGGAPEDALGVIGSLREDALLV